MVEDDVFPIYLSTNIQWKIQSRQPLEAKEEELVVRFNEKIERRNTIAEKAIGIMRTSATSTVTAHYIHIELIPSATATSEGKFKMMWPILDLRFKGDRTTQTTIIEQIREEMREQGTPAQTDQEAARKLYLLMGFETELACFADGRGRLSVEEMQGRVITILLQDKYQTVINQVTQKNVGTVAECITIFVAEAARLRRFVPGSTTQGSAATSPAAQSQSVGFTPSPPITPAVAATTFDPLVQIQQECADLRRQLKRQQEDRRERDRKRETAQEKEKDIARGKEKEMPREKERETTRGIGQETEREIDREREEETEKTEGRRRGTMAEDMKTSKDGNEKAQLDKNQPPLRDRRHRTARDRELEEDREAETATTREVGATPGPRSKWCARRGCTSEERENKQTFWRKETKGERRWTRGHRFRWHHSVWRNNTIC